jgi:hypothetical protein
MKTLRAGLAFLLISLFFSSVLSADVRYDKGDRRDPFIPLVGPEGIVDARKFDTSDINIEGIIHDPHGESLVLINGEFYKEGDNVKGANVISIFQDRVILGQSDEQKVIWIREEILNEGELKDDKKPAHEPAPKSA